MSSASSAAKRGVAPASKAPLRLRLKAWWEGYDLSEAEAASHARGAAGGGSAAAGGSGAARALPFRPWSEIHLEVMQAVWGAGMVGPGNPDFIRHLVKPLGLNPAMSVIDIGAGLGGAARVMAETFGVWVTAMEAEPKLASAGMEMSEAADMDKKAPVAAFDPEICEPKPRGFDCVVSLGYFFRVKNKARLIEALDFSLKNGGQMLITDYVLEKPGQENEHLRAWIEGEPDEVAPWSVAQYNRALVERGLEVRIAEDITDTTRQQIVGAWADHMATVGQDAGDPRTAETLVHEVEYWTRRVQALQKGGLRVYRIYARKQSSSNLLSDW